MIDPEKYIASVSKILWVPYSAYYIPIIILFGRGQPANPTACYPLINSLARKGSVAIQFGWVLNAFQFNVFGTQAPKLLLKQFVFVCHHCIMYLRYVIKRNVSLKVDPILLTFIHMFRSNSFFEIVLETTRLRCCLYVCQSLLKN